MKYIILDILDVVLLNNINTSRNDRHIEAMELTDKRWVVDAAYLDDPYWSDYSEVLSGKPQEDIDNNSLLLWWNKLVYLLNRDGIVITPEREQELYDYYVSKGEL